MHKEYGGGSHWEGGVRGEPKRSKVLQTKRDNEMVTSDTRLLFLSLTFFLSLAGSLSLSRASARTHVTFSLSRYFSFLLSLSHASAHTHDLFLSLCLSPSLYLSFV